METPNRSISYLSMQIYGNIVSFKKYFFINNLKFVYHALIKTRLQYGIVLWGNTNQSALKSLNTMYNRAIQYITVQPYRTRLNM